MKRFTAAAMALLAGIAFGQSVWPPLPSDGFVSGRAATLADISAGRAAFVANSIGVPIGKPLAISVPQYAWLNQRGVKVPVIIIQAETANGQTIVGALLSNGAHAVATLPEFELLGRVAPK